MSLAISRSNVICAIAGLILIECTGCVSAAKTGMHHPRKKSYCSLEQLVGNDTYFYSDRYQKKLKRSISRRTTFY